MEALEVAREKYRTHSVRWGFYWALWGLSVFCVRSAFTRQEPG
jgi:hypothetical protein